MGYLFVFVEYLCNRSLKIKTKIIKNYSSILAIINHSNWLDDSPPLRRYLPALQNSFASLSLSRLRTVLNGFNSFVTVSV